MICSLSYDDSSVEPLRSHPVRHAFLGTQMPSGPSTEVYILDLWAWFCYGFGWPGLHVWWCMIWCHLIFPTHHKFDVILGIFPLSIEIYRSPLIRVIIPSYEIHIRLVILFHFIMTLWWICLWVISSGSHFPMSVWFLDGVVSGSWILASLFCRITCQIFHPSSLSYSWVIMTDRIHLMPY